MEKYEVNKVNTDEFGRINGVFAYNKPVNTTSHDVVSLFRRHFKTKRVGHAGTLDPFADGLLIVLVGKATKLSDTFLSQDKEYKARILLGVETNSGDPEGEIINQIKYPVDLTEDQIHSTLKSFVGSYMQHVPVFSSVKIKGQKLRELARKYSSFKIDKEKKIVQFLDKDSKIVKEIELPSKTVNIYSLAIIEIGKIEKSEIESVFKNSYGNKDKSISNDLLLNSYTYVDVVISVSKGTYIRQFAIDVGNKLSCPSMLLNLTRTKIGEFSIENTYSIS